MSRFEIICSDGDARIGRLKTNFGYIETPFFMSVATKAIGKHFNSLDLNSIQQRAIICNSLLLSMKPGSKVIEQMGGIHSFMNYDGIISTDCGGFQASRGFFVGKTKKGLNFKNPFDKSPVKITPQSIMQTQLEINSDIAMMLDDMSPWGASYDESKVAMELTHKWGKESFECHSKLKKEKQSNQMLFGIVQGNFFEDLREESAKFISSLNFDGIAIGGIAIGEPKEEMYKAVNSSIPHLPKEKPKYIMGLGTPVDILNMIEKGIDMWDSIYPTKVARHGTLFTNNGLIYVDKGIYKTDKSKVDEDCDCPMCKNYTKSYIYHLAKLNDLNGKRLMSLHNIRFIERMIIRAKKAIKEKRFKQFKEDFIKKFENKL